MLLTSRTYDSTFFASLLAGFKAHLRVTANDLDTQLTACLKASISSAEQFVGMYLVKSAVTLSGPFARVTELPYPLLYVTGVTVQSYGPGGVVIATELLPGEYSVKGNTLVIADTVTAEDMGVTCTIGRSVMEDDIQAAIFLRAARLFNNPADSPEVMINASDNLLSPYRRLHGE